MLSKGTRRQRIRELLAHNQVLSQEQLQELLGRRGVAATQATLSRDLRDLGVLKGPAGYRLPDLPLSAAPHRNGSRELDRLIAAELLSAETGGNLVVLRTQPGHANPMALEIDKAQLAGVMGTIAGDDTVFVAASTNQQAGRVVRQIRKMAGWS